MPDFNAGAMENWGLIIYRESALLYNRETDSISNQRRVSSVVSHELAHQWVRFFLENSKFDSNFSSEKYEQTLFFQVNADLKS